MTHYFEEFFSVSQSAVDLSVFQVATLSLAERLDRVIKVLSTKSVTILTFFEKF